MNRAPITVALPKGRLHEPARDMLAAAGYRFDRSERELVTTEANGELRAISVKNADLPIYVQHGIADLGICGSDVIYESGETFYELLELPFGTTRICLCGRDNGHDRPDNATLQVATKFARFTRDFFHTRGVAVSIIELGGSVELAPVLGLAPYIVDLVETGDTLRAHGLVVKRELARTSVRLIANPARYKYFYRRIDAFVDRVARVAGAT